MKKSILEIYALIVCLISLIWCVIAVGAGAYNIISMTAPNLTIASYEYTRYLSNDNYKDHCCNKKDESRVLTDEELTKKRTEGLKIALDEEKRQGLRELIKNVIAIALNIVVFGSHWLLARRARQV